MEQAVSRHIIRSCSYFELSMTLNILKAVKTSSLFYTTKVRSLIRCIRLNKGFKLPKTLQKDPI